MSYLDLVEEYPRDFKLTLFEKVIMASKRAKDLHTGKAPLLATEYNEPYQAIAEVKEGLIGLVYHDNGEPEKLDTDKEEGDEE